MPLHNDSMGKRVKRILTAGMQRKAGTP